MTDGEIHAFGEFRLDAGQRRLSRGADSIDLPPKAFDALLLLVRRAGQLVGRDEFSAVLWPGVIVSETNLGKYIWQLRKALGEQESEARYIQTVSKQGYRFVAPVTRLGADAPEAVASDRAEPVQPTPSRRHRALVWALPLAAICAIAAVVAIWILRPASPPPAQMTATQGKPTTIALFDITPGSHQIGDVWLSTALSELLSYELRLNQRLHVISGTQLAELTSRTNGAAPDRAALGRLRLQLGVELAIIGRYHDASGPGGDRLRLELQILNAATGAVLQTANVTGSRQHPGELVAAAAARLRQSLRAQPSPEAQDARGSIASDDPEVLKSYADGVLALRQGDSNRARTALNSAVARAPDFLPAQLELARTLQIQGYDARAAEVARTALAHAGDAPRELKMALEASMYEAQKTWPQAIEAYRALRRLDPDQLEYGLGLARAQAKGDNVNAAIATIAELRRDHGETDPRIDLTASELANSRGDAAASREATERAVRSARALQAPHLIAQALLARAWSRDSGDNASLGEIQEALALFRQLDDPIWLARGYNGFAGYYWDRGDFARATELYQQALVLFEAAGVKVGQAAALANLANIAWSQDKRGEVKRRLETLLQLARELADPDRETWTLSALATVQADMGQTAAAIAGYRQAIAAAARHGLEGQRARILYELAELLRLRGEYAEAISLVDQSLVSIRALKIPGIEGEALHRSAQLQLDRGDLAAARTQFEASLASSRREQREYTGAATEIELAAVALAEGKADEALQRIARALPVLESNDAQSGIARANALRAEALLAQHHPEQARAALASALAFTQTHADTLDAFPIWMSEVRVLMADRQEAQAQARLRDIKQHARRRDLPGLIAQAEALQRTTKTIPDIATR